MEDSDVKLSNLTEHRLYAKYKDFIDKGATRVARMIISDYSERIEAQGIDSEEEAAWIQSVILLLAATYAGSSLLKAMTWTGMFDDDDDANQEEGDECKKEMN